MWILIRTRSCSSSQQLLRCVLFTHWNRSVSNRLKTRGCPQTQRGYFNVASGPRAVLQGCEVFLQGIHEFSHLPWWAVILYSTAVLRTLITLPLAVHQNKVLARMELLQPTIKEYSEAIKHRVVGRCRREGLPVDEANRKYKKEVFRHISSRICVSPSLSPGSQNGQGTICQRRLSPFEDSTSTLGAVATLDCSLS